MSKQSLTLALLLIGAASAPVLAQEMEPSAQPQRMNKPLAGSVQMTVDPTMRIDRSRLRRSAGIDASNDFPTNLLPMQPQMAPLLDSSAFQGAVRQAQRAPAPLLKTAATASDTKDKVAPYVWYQSALGGYYDGSGTTKEIVRADRLHLFGGKFQDGTLVPLAPIRDYNAMGHAFRHDQLNTTHFWNH